MEELVDILVTTYNTNEKYLEKQIDSILKQTYKNIRIYISDDCSTEQNIKDILKKYQELDNRIKLFLQPKNLGYNKNFEFLLQQSKADYIMFSDHDDVWHKDKVEKSLKKLKEENVDMVYCNCRQIDEDGLVIQDDYFKYKNVPLIKGKSNLAISRCVGIGCSQIITKSVRDKMIPFKKSVIAHDWLAAFIANEGKGMCYIRETLFDYRLHNTNVFGGRSFSQNISRWKKKNGSDYNSFLKYREDAINRAYLGGVRMCADYVNNAKDKKFIEKNINYYETILKHKCIYYMNTYFEILAGKNQLKKMIKEILLFHFPIIAYIAFKRVKVVN